MSLLDTHKSNILRKKAELVKLQSLKSDEARKKSAQSKKIIDAKKTLSRTKVTATINSKLREIANAEKASAAIDKKMAEIDGKIVKKEKEIASEESKYQKEEERGRNKRDREDKKRLAESEKKMNQFSRTIDEHDRKHTDTQLELEKLKSLPEKITVLFMATNPIDSDQLRLDEEARAIEKMIRLSKHRESVQLETRWAVRSSDILQAINELNPAIIHFSGHGTETDMLVLQNADGTSKYVSKEAIVQSMMTSSNKIRLVYFNTCFSSSQAEAVVEYIESAIGMTDSISDYAARVFAAQFYSAIGFGLSLQQAFQQAKALLMLDGILEEDTPELYVRDGLEAGELFIVKPKDLPLS